MAMKHGYSRYCKDGCRCDTCTTANREYKQAWRADSEKVATLPQINSRILPDKRDWSDYR